MPRDTDRPLWERRFLAPTRTFPVWSRRAPDRAVYLSDEEGSFQAYAWDLVADTHRRLSDESVGVDLATISSDGSEAIWFSDPTGDESGRWIARSFDGGGEWRDLLPGAPIGWPDGLAIGRSLVGGVIADRDGFAVYVSEDGGPAKEIHRDVDALSIAPTDFHLEGFDLAGLSADDSLLCVEAAQDGDNIHRLLRVLDPRTGRVVAELADGEGFGLSAFAWSPIEGDQRLLAAHEREDLMRPTIWDPTTGERIDLEVDLPGEVIPVDWFPAADAILVAHLFRGRDTAYRLELASGTLTEIVHPRGELHGARVRPDGRVWVRVSTSDRASRVLDDVGAHVLAEPEGGVRDGRPYRDWVFADPEGGTLHGWIALPDGEPPFPTYLKVHGGPSWLYLDTWWPDVQMLLDLGFAVGMVNYRGSTGYGRQHRDHIIRNVGFPEVADTVAGPRRPDRARDRRSRSRRDRRLVVGRVHDATGARDEARQVRGRRGRRACRRLPGVLRRQRSVAAGLRPLARRRGRPRRPRVRRRALADHVRRPGRRARPRPRRRERHALRAGTGVRLRRCVEGRRRRGRALLVRRRALVLHRRGGAPAVAGGRRLPRADRPSSGLRTPRGRMRCR